MRKTFAHEIAIRLPVDEAFPLFTPKGEEAWVPGWEPDYVSPPDGTTVEEMVFVTRNHETTYWTCLKWEPDLWHARYLRLTPDSRVAFVDVLCRPEGDGNTIVRVAYTFVPLTDHGREHVEAVTRESFAASIDGWADLIHVRREATPAA
jgi:hypothetical protein